jgi:tryptophanyl-tRNA synthetase
MMMMFANTMPQSPQPAGVVMSGMRSTGSLHLGHYMGVLKNWVALQHQHPCFFMVADWHALTTKYDDTKQIPQYRVETVLDWLAAGLEPEKCVIYFQSQIPEIAELHLLLSMMTPVKWLETDPTLKDMIAIKKTGEAPVSGEELNYGLLGYPVLQTADILTVGGQLVPVGKDQLAHLEISRDIARRFNYMVGEAVFAEPKPLLTETPLLLGLDGRKMSKSYNNTVFLKETEDETWLKIKTAITDAQRLKKTDAGNPQACVAVFPWYQIFADTAEQMTVAQECEQALRGCMDCKKQLTERVNETMRPLRERRQLFEQDLSLVHRILVEGQAQAREQAATVLQRVRSVLHLTV